MKSFISEDFLRRVRQIEGKCQQNSKQKVICFVTLSQFALTVSDSPTAP
jgi:hypothetical protein